MSNAIAKGEISRRPTSSRSFSLPEEGAQIEAVVGEVERALEVGEIKVPDADELADLRAQLDTLRAQIKSPKPKRA